MNGYWIAAAVVAVIVVGVGLMILPDVVRYLRISRM
jgi:hypothetical protein